MANMTYAYLNGVAGGGLFILLHTHLPPADSEWHPYNQELVRVDQTVGIEKCGTIVFTDGGSPGGPQRKLVADLLKGRASICAVVTANPLVRGAVTALSWFNSKIKAFPPDQVDAALEYIGVQSHEIGLVRREALALSKKLGPIPLRSLGGITADPTSKRGASL